MSVALSTAPSGVSRMTLADAVGLGATAWATLESRTARPSPFMSWAWHRAWLDAAPSPEAAESEVLLLRGADGALQALLPLASRRVRFHRVPVTALTWATGELGCPDHLDIPALPDVSVAEFAGSLEALPWDLVILSNLAGGSETTTQRLCEAMAERGYDFRREPLWPCPYLDLPSDWDRYLGSLTANRRQTLRRKERQLQREGVTITDYDVDGVAAGLDHLIALHTRRWENDGQGGAFEDPMVRRLHQRFAVELAARGKLWLSTLDVAGAPVAAWYGFAWGDTVYFYQSGRDPAWERHSVGLVLMGTMIQRAIERGYRRFDFLRGADPYKRQWTTTDRMTEQITIFRRGLGGRALRALDAAGQLRARLRGSAGVEA